jgi:hypothetical protein
MIKAKAQTPLLVAWRSTHLLLCSPTISLSQWSRAVHDVLPQRSEFLVHFGRPNVWLLCEGLEDALRGAATAHILCTLDESLPIRKLSWRGYFGAVCCGSKARTLMPASVYGPKRRTVALASNEIGTHIPPSCAYCRVI